MPDSSLPAALLRDTLQLFRHDAERDDQLSLLRRIDALPVGPDMQAALRDAMHTALEVRTQLAQHQQKERGLLALIDTAQDLTALRDADQVLQAIVRRARQLVGSDVGYLSILDTQAGDFYVRATDGAFSDEFKRIRVPGDVGICSYVARQRAAYSSSDYGPDSRFSHTPQIDHAVHAEGVHSILGVPLPRDDGVIGVLFVGERYTRRYTPWEVSILSTLALHAAVALENARLFTQAQTALATASEANARLQRQSEDTQLAADTHEQLTALVARGGSLQDIVAMVAATLRGQAAVLDATGARLAGAGGDLGVASPRLRQAMQNSHAAGRSIPLTLDTGVCQVAAINSGSGLLGAVALLAPQDLPRVGIRILERAALVTGIVLLAQERAQFALSGEAASLVRELLGRGPAADGTWQARLRHLGVDPQAPLQLILVDTDEDRHAHALRRLRAAPRPAGSVIDEFDGCVVALANAAQAQALHDAVRRQLADPSVPVTTLISEPADAASELPATFRRARQAMGFMRALGRTGQAGNALAFGIYAPLFDGQSAAELDAFLSATLGPLTHDDRLRDTLLVWLDHGRNLRQAASSLGIHVNTVRQRLESVASLLGEEKLAAHALELHVAARLAKLRDTPAR